MSHLRLLKKKKKKISPKVRTKNASFHSEIQAEGYHVFSIRKANLPNFYPNKFPDYPGVKLDDLKIGDIITIRAFFPRGKGKPVQVDSGYIDLEIEHVDLDHVMAMITTELPKGFVLGTGDTIELWQDDILFKREPLGD